MRNPTLYKSAATFLFLLIFVCADLQAQNNQQYHIGNRLLQQQKFEQAYNIFNELYKQQPQNYLFLEKATEALINLKRYERAREMAQNAIEQSANPAQPTIRLGEIYHVQGDTSRAYTIWNNLLDGEGTQFQTYLEVARAMSNRRSFSRAVDVYEQARQQFSSSTILSTELANTYMQAGQYENAIQEFLALVREEPERIDYVQRSLIRYGDEMLHDTAILEIEDFMDELSLDHPAYRRLHQLQVWLLLERNLYERAVATAKAYEERTPEVTYSLLGLGNNLVSEQEYDLAEETYRFYIDQNIEPAKYQSMEELSRVYTEWADYLADYNLAYATRRDSLHKQAFDILSQLRQEAPFYDQMEQVLLRQSELAINYLHDMELAKKYLRELRARQNASNVAEQFYVEGRIELYESDYDRARIAFTRSNKQQEIGALAEKTRYYLALTDFYAGDYEFAKIQLNALERQNTSYYANDAVQLRLWIQKGLNADSTGSIIEPFARGVEYFNQGNQQKAIESLAPILSGESYHPLMDEALLELSRNISPKLAGLYYGAVSDYLQRWGQTSALRERLMWEKARVADQVVSYNITLNDNQEAQNSTAGQFFESAPEQAELPTNQQQVQKLYEDILLEFPSGFYASYARDRIQELKNPQT